jgi:hypothetical protein
MGQSNSADDYDKLRQDLEKNLDAKLNLLLADTIDLFTTAEIATPEITAAITMVLVRKLVVLLGTTTVDPVLIFQTIIPRVKEAQERFRKAASSFEKEN